MPHETPPPSSATPAPSDRPVHLLSIDVEDIVVAATDLYLQDPPAGYKETVENDVRRTLEVLEASGARATFFMNSRYCDDHDGMMRDIVAAGHALATHGHRHFDARKLTIEEFRDDLRRSIDILTRYQTDVVGYRPPAYTMPFDDEHFRVLLDNGIRYLSCGALMDRVRVPHVEKPVWLDCGLYYIPVSIWYLLGGKVRYPVGYGHTSRLMPEGLVVSMVKKFIRRAEFFQFYFHPYEVPGITREQKRTLFAVEKDIGFRIYAQRSHDRSRLFTRILSAGHFEPIESIRSNFDG